MITEVENRNVILSDRLRFTLKVLQECGICSIFKHFYINIPHKTNEK